MLEVNKYYWIKVDGIVHKHIPAYRNLYGQWCYDTLTTIIFLSDTKLKQLHGKDCIIRQVNFDTDVCDMVDITNEMYYFVSDKDTVLFGNTLVFWYGTACCIQHNKFDNCMKLVYKEV